MANITLKLVLPVSKYSQLKANKGNLSISRYVRKALDPYINKTKFLALEKKEDTQGTTFLIPYPDYVKLQRLCDSYDVAVETMVRKIILEQLEEDEKNATEVHT